MSDPQPASVPGDQFPTTHWSRVVAAQDPAAPEARHALTALCTDYWYPIYAFIRRRGFGPDQAADLTRGFFARLRALGVEPDSSGS
jgi:RNA polymerase sigma-70 factor (ECF subfamily)